MLKTTEPNNAGAAETHENDMTRQSEASMLLEEWRRAALRSKDGKGGQSQALRSESEIEDPSTPTLQPLDRSRRRERRRTHETMAVEKARKEVELEVSGEGEGRTSGPAETKDFSRRRNFERIKARHWVNGG